MELHKSVCPAAGAAESEFWGQQGVTSPARPAGQAGKQCVLLRQDNPDPGHCPEPVPADQLPELLGEWAGHAVPGGVGQQHCCGGLQGNGIHEECPGGLAGTASGCTPAAYHQVSWGSLHDQACLAKLLKCLLDMK